MANGNPNPSNLGPLKLISSPGDRVYLDHNATTPVAAFLKEKVGEWIEHWGNPSSIHWAGRGPKALLRDSRRTLAKNLNCDALELIFTSGGSESNNLALKGLFLSLHKRHLFSDRNQYLISAVEHPSLMKAAEQLKTRGADIQIIPVLRSGEIDLHAYETMLSNKTALVSVMFANNETGHIYPIKKMAEMAHAHGALFHCDAVQALGKAPLDLKELNVDMATLSGHKFYALKGCGLLYAKRGVQLESLISGGGQERGRRAGTENLLAIASFAAMSDHLIELPQALERMSNLRDTFERRIGNLLPGIHITGAAGTRVANTSSLVIEGVDGETLLMNLDMRGFSVSTGAACSSGSPEPSPVLLAMGLTRHEAQSSLRISLGWTTTDGEMERFITALVQVVERLRSFDHGAKALLGV